jgi:hypothetical protein
MFFVAERLVPKSYHRPILASPQHSETLQNKSISHLQELIMAIPPEPIAEVMPDVAAAVVAEVTHIHERGPQKPFPQPRLPNEVDIPCQISYQIVELSIKRVVFGAWLEPNTSLRVYKPAGDYVLSPGNHGPFLLTQPQNINEQTLPVIIGRYGPDSYPLELIEIAIRQHRKP